MDWKEEELMSVIVEQDTCVSERETGRTVGLQGVERGKVHEVKNLDSTVQI